MIFINVHYYSPKSELTITLVVVEDTNLLVAGFVVVGIAVAVVVAVDIVAVPETAYPGIARSRQRPSS
jgi:hypothetical protein